MRGLSTEIEALRVETGKLETGMLAAQRGTLSDRPDPATARRLAGNKEQLKRLQSRQSEGHARLMPRIDLARRALAYAKTQRMEVGSYAF